MQALSTNPYFSCSWPKASKRRAWNKSKSANRNRPVQTSASLLLLCYARAEQEEVCKRLAFGQGRALPRALAQSASESSISEADSSSGVLSFAEHGQQLPKQPKLTGNKARQNLAKDQILFYTIIKSSDSVDSSFLSL